MARAMRSAAINHNSGWATDPENALNNNADFAKDVNLGAQCQYYGFNFTRLPDVLTVTGISIRLEASKDHIAGSGDPKIDVALSWNSGSSWSNVETTAKLALLTQSTFIVGGVDEMWGVGSWLREYLADTDKFRVRVECAGSPTSNPGWRLHYLTATVHYVDDDTPTDTANTIVSVGDRFVSSILHDIVYDSLGVNDAGSQSPSSGRAPRGSMQITESGTAVTLLQSDSTFSATAERPGRDEAFGAAIQLAVDGPTIYVGDSTVLTDTINTYPYSHMQPGLLSVTDLTSEATFVDGFFITTVEITLANIEYVDQSDDASPTPRKLSEHALGLPSVGRSLTVWGMAESGDGWKKHIVFNGEVEDMQHFDSEIIIRGIQLGTTQKPVPDIIVDENLFTYEPGSSKVDTGEQIESNKGKAVPVGIGRFDYSAVKLEADYDAGHPFRFTAQSPLPAEEDMKIYSQIALFPAMMGMLHPMMPTIHVARRYRRVESSALPHSHPWQNVLLYGTRKSSPHLDVSLNYDNPSTTFAMQYPNYDTHLVTDLSVYNADRYVLVWTWHNSEHGSRGIPFVKPIRDSAFTEKRGDIGLSDWIHKHCSAGTMEHLGQPGLDNRWTDGTADNAYGIFINIRAPKNFLIDWPGAWQTIALQMAGLTEQETPTRSIDLYQFENPREQALGVLAPDFGVSPTFQTRDVTDPDNCIKLDVPEAVTNVASGGSLSLQLPIDGPNLGTPRSVKFCMLWNPTTSGASEVRLLARFGPFTNYGLIHVPDGLADSDYNLNKNVEFDRATYDVPILKLTGVTDRSFASFSLQPYFDPHTGKYANHYETEAKEFNIVWALLKIWQQGRFKAPWSFLGRDKTRQVDSPVNQTFHWPGDVMVQAVGGDLDIVACWLEVVHQSRLGNDGKEPLEQEFVLHHEGFDQYNAAGRRIGHVPGYSESITTSAEYTRPNPRLSTESNVFVTGKGLIDYSGELTGVAKKIVEHPVDICNALIRHYLGDSVFQARATGSEFGSFDTARTILGADAYRLCVVINPTHPINIKQVLTEIGLQSMCVVREHLDANGDKQWIMYVDHYNPESVDTARVYSGFTNNLIAWNNLAAGSLSVSFVPYEDLSSSVSLRYGLHLPTGKWSGTMFCTPEATNFATEGTLYKDALEFTRTEYNVANPLQFDAPDVWDPAVAEKLCKWHCNQVRLRRVFVEFETYANAFNLEPGHVIKFDNEIQDHIEYPGLGSPAWSSHPFNVEQVSTSKVAGQLARVYVRALEVHTTLF